VRQENADLGGIQAAAHALALAALAENQTDRTILTM
jgi:hypothetical protein